MQTEFQREMEEAKHAGTARKVYSARCKILTDYEYNRTHYEPMHNGHSRSRWFHPGTGKVFWLRSDSYMVWAGDTGGEGR